jgi:membrane protease YdiL (CAAX protease family)
MKKTFLKILKYTVVFMLIINLYKIFIQNTLFHNDYSSGYLIAMTILKVSLFIITLFLLHNEKIKVSNFNKTKCLLLIIGIVVFARLYHNVLSESEIYKMNIDYFKLTFYSLHNFFIGLFEEFYFRLYIFSLLCSLYKKNLFKISVLTSFLFAIVHLSNLLLNSYSCNDVVFQVMFAFAIGIFFQILLIKFKNIYIPVLIHFFIDFNSDFSGKFFNVSPKEVNDTGFDYSTFGIVLTFIILTLIFAYFNLRKKEVGYFNIEETLK